MAGIIWQYVDKTDESEIPIGYGGFGPQPSNITDIEIISNSGQMLAHVSAGGGHYIYAIGANGDLSFLNAYPNLYESLGGFFGGELAIFTSGGLIDIASSVGATNTNAGVSFFGQIGNSTLFQLGGSLTDNSSLSIAFNNAQITSWKHGGQDYFAIPSYSEAGFSAFAYDINGVVTHVGNGKTTKTLGAYSSNYQFVDIEYVKVGGKQYLYLSGELASSVAAFKIKSDGTIVQIDKEADSFYSFPGWTGQSVLKHAQVGSKDFLINHSNGHLTIYKIDHDNGKLTEINSYNWQGFNHNSEIETINYKGHTYVLMPDWHTRQDGGFAIYELSSRGKLTHLDDIGDGTLTDATDIEAYVVGDSAYVLMGDGNYDSLLSFKFDLSGVSAVPINGNGNNNTLKGTSDDDIINGKGGNDKIFGKAGNDKIYGGKGNDKLYGEDDADTLVGGIGKDKLSGGAGNDRLKGGSGADEFIFRKNFESDKIIGFSDTDDTLNLKSFDFDSVKEAKSYAQMVNGDTVFDFGNGDVLTLVNFDKSDLDGGDFIL